MVLPRVRHFTPRAPDLRGEGACALPALIDHLRSRSRSHFVVIVVIVVVVVGITMNLYYGSSSLNYFCLPLL